LNLIDQPFSNLSCHGICILIDWKQNQRIKITKREPKRYQTDSTDWETRSRGWNTRKVYVENSARLQISLNYQSRLISIIPIDGRITLWIPY